MGTNHQGKRPSVFTVPPSAPFAEILAQGILDECGSEPTTLSAVTILLPTRRACRTLREAFLRTTNGTPLLLPTMTPLGDVDEDVLAMVGFGGLETGHDAAEIPPAISGLRRQLLLTHLVQAFEKEKTTVDQAATLAAELARLLDQVHTERLNFDRLKNLVPEEYAEHWQVTLKFLEIVTAQWPEILKDEGTVDPAERRNLLLAAQAKHWQEFPPDFPVIAAGSTGSIPATADLLKVIARLPKGQVLLPGFDVTMDEKTRAALEASHPQFGMHQLLETMQVSPAEVEIWGPARTRPPRQIYREPLIAQAMRPAASIQWRQAKIQPECLSGLSLVECPTQKEEAGVIALALRETLEHVETGRTAALITPDRTLARRVTAELRRWGVEIDDSAGQPLSHTPPGAFLRLTARLAAESFAPLPLLAVLKHPLAACGRGPAALRRLTRQLEMDTLRGPRPAPGLGALAARAKTPETVALLADLEKAAAPFSAKLAEKSVPLPELLRAHVTFMESIASGEESLWAGEAGEELAGFIAELMEATRDMGAIEPAAYGALLDTFMVGRAVRPRYGGHPRLAILGLLEARLVNADLVILGGLNEGSWPPETTASPWMSRPMMERFGLPLPERRIGLTAHDFSQAFCAPEVLMTRAQRVDGSPTVPSRWLLRLDTLLKGAEIGRLRGEGADSLQWKHWQRRLDEPDKRVVIPRPAPRPPVSARPRKLWVTHVETWMRDPYAVYARHILGLKALDPLDADPGAAEYGTLIHGALEAFTNRFPKIMPKNAKEELLVIGQDVFSEAMALPGVWAFWWPRFERIVDWFVALEGSRRDAIVQTIAEATGEMTVQGPAGPFTLCAKADRIDVMHDGTLALIDYKTGAPPSQKEVAAGFAPQLPLEAAIAQDGGFKGVKASEVSTLEFWRLRGGDPAGEIRAAGKDTAALAEEALEGLENLIRAFDRPETPYEARPNPEMAPKYSDYGHLARVKEWSTGEEGGEL